MTPETINQNIHRLCHFLNMPEDQWPHFTDQHMPEYLLQQYGHILDYHGASRAGLSRLFLPPEEYAELLEWASPPATAISWQHEDENTTIHNGDQLIPVMRKASLGFMYDGYEWDIQKIENWKS